MNSNDLLLSSLLLSLFSSNAEAKVDNSTNNLLILLLALTASGYGMNGNGCGNGCGCGGNPWNYNNGGCGCNGCPFATPYNNYPGCGCGRRLY